MKHLSTSLLVLSSFLVAPRALAICDDAPCIKIPPIHAPVSNPKASDPEAVCQAGLIKSWEASQPSLGYGSAGFSKAMDQAMSMSRERLTSMGEAGRSWMCRDFAWSEVAASMRSVYDWLVAEGQRPPCVVLD